MPNVACYWSPCPRHLKTGRGERVTGEFKNGGQAHVNDKTIKDDSSYVMIIEMKLLCKIGLTVDTSNSCLR
jgi:hypothetical protein